MRIPSCGLVFFMGPVMIQVVVINKTMDIDYFEKRYFYILQLHIFEAETTGKLFLFQKHFK